MAAAVTTLCSWLVLLLPSLLLHHPLLLCTAFLLGLSPAYRIWLLLELYKFVTVDVLPD